MDKLILQFDEVFWDEDIDWLNYCSDSSIPEWAETFNNHKYQKNKVLTIFNTYQAALKYSSKTDDECIESALVALNNMYPNRNITR